MKITDQNTEKEMSIAHFVLTNGNDVHGNLIWLRELVEEAKDKTTIQEANEVIEALEDLERDFDLEGKSSKPNKPKYLEQQVKQLETEVERLTMAVEFLAEEVAAK